MNSDAEGRAELHVVDGARIVAINPCRKIEQHLRDALRLIWSRVGVAAKLKHGVLKLAEGDETIAIIVKRAEEFERAGLSGGALLAHLRNGALAGA